MNWRGKPVTTHRVIVELIAAIITTSALRVDGDLDPGYYPTGQKVTDKQLAALPIRRQD